MSALQRKLFRDLVRLWPQSLAIALVIAGGAATLLMGRGSYSSLMETRAAYYERNRFAHVFVDLSRAPKDHVETIAQIPGVESVEPRISKIAMLDMPGVLEPAAAVFVSLPDSQQQSLNLLHLRSGRLPFPADDAEVVVSETFAKAHNFGLGAGFEAILNGRKRQLRVVGTALSPEFIYAVGPWDLMPDDRRFGVVWMSEKTLAGAYDLNGAFSSVHLSLMRGASERDVIQRLDHLLTPFGGQGAYGRKNQTSHAFLDAELMQLESISRVLPPIFLIVAAFLVNMMLSRIVALEREQIGLLKALGYSNFTIGLHYWQFAGAIATIGVGIGLAAGAWLGHGMTRLYSEFFHFPFLMFRTEPSVYAASIGTAFLATTAGALKAVREAVRLAPAVAMAPPSPARYRVGFADRLTAALHVSQIVVIPLRHLTRWPLRTLSSIIGVALSAAILVGSLWSFGSIETMIDITFHQSERQDATIAFAREQPERAAFEIAALPGVLSVESYRTIPIKVRHGHVERRVAITGKSPGGDLSRVLNADLAPVTLPQQGIALSDMLADILKSNIGDTIEIEILEREHRRVFVPVAAIIKGYLGLNAYMDIRAVNALMREGAMISGAHISYDSQDSAALFAALKKTPVASFIALQPASLRKFRETLAQNILIQTIVLVLLASIIAFGVIYNFARISLSEQGRELASLRVLGFTRGEASGILLSELAATTILALPVGWLCGYAIAHLVVSGFETELYRVPLVIEREVYGWASIVVAVAAIVSALVVRRRVDQLDLVAVLKTRE